jgi:hypothetical protein
LTHATVALMGGSGRSVELATEPDDPMDDFKLLIDLHITADRQGPGGEAETRRAIELAGLAKRRNLKLADIGCGTGASIRTRKSLSTTAMAACLQRASGGCCAG